MEKLYARLLLAVTVAVASIGCDRNGGFSASIGVIEVEIESPDAPPPGATVTALLEYEEIAEKRRRMEEDVTTTAVALDPALVAALDPAPFARIAHLTDAQIREERGFLVGSRGSVVLDGVSSSYIPTEGTKRQALQETNSPFVWLATVLTLNALHAQRPIDVAIHTGDMVDIGLESELDHFLFASRKLVVPFLAVAGNHDILGFGIWNQSGPAFGLSLDDDVEVRSAAQPAFAANMDGLVLDRPEHAAAFRRVSSALGPHAPTQARFGSVHSGYDLGPQPDDLFYTVVVKTATASEPGLQLIVLETTLDRGGAGPDVESRQLAFLNDTLDSADARRNIIVVAAHHPVFEVHRSDGGLGPRAFFRTSDPLKPLERLLSHYPNVALYLCGHTHLPEVVEARDPVGGALRWVQVDAGSILIHPQEGAIIDLAFPAAGELRMRMRKVGPQVDAGSALGLRVGESRAAAAADVQSRPRYATWTTHEATKTLPAFPVTVPRF